MTSNSWDAYWGDFPRQVLEVGNVGSRLHVARKERRPDDWEPPYEPCDPCGPGEDPIIEKVADEVLKRVTPEEATHRPADAPHRPDDE